MIVNFIFTNFNNFQYTENAIKSINHNHLLHTVGKIVVVDNASDKKDILSLEEMSNGYDNVEVIFSEKNVGYFAGLNLGIRFLKNNFNNLDLVVIGNNDVIFPENFVESIFEKSDLLSLYPVISPNIITSDGVHQNPHVINKISVFREFIYDVYHFNYLFAKLILKLARLTHFFTDRKDEEQHDIAQEIHQGYGACYILGPKFFEFFDELWSPTFLMYEEYFLSKQLLDKGFMTYYEPSIKLTHLMHATTDKLPGKLKWEFSKIAHKEYRKYVKVF